MQDAIANRPGPPDSGLGAGRQFCLVEESVRGGDDPSPDTRSQSPRCSTQSPGEPLLVPPTRSLLVAPAGAPPRIVTEPNATPAENRWCALEPIRRGHMWQLLLARCSGDTLEVNGVPAPPIAVLEERDVITFDDGRVNLHVSTYVRPYIGPVPEGVAGRNCSFCQTPIPADATVYLCPFCDAPAHVDSSDEPDASQRLDCARSMGTCPNCTSPVVTNEGLTYIPEEALGG